MMVVGVDKKSGFEDRWGDEAGIEAREQEESLSNAPKKTRGTIVKGRKKEK